jgi:hypothetical protein
MPTNVKEKAILRWARVVVAAVMMVVASRGTAWAQPGGTTGAPKTSPETQQECIPSCRAGYLCVKGACVSACNPPCATNEVCTAEGQCLARNTPPAPPPASPVTPVPPPGTAAAPTTPAPPTPPPQPASAPPAPPRKSEDEAGVHRHDGFYFRVALGLGALISDGSVHGANINDVETSGHGAALLGELSIGGTVAPGLVIGGGNWNAVAISPTATYRNVSSSGVAGSEHEISEPVVYPFGVLGPFVDWYTDPTAGFHLQLAIGLATGGYKEPSGAADDSITGVRVKRDVTMFGLGGMIGIGSEWWIGEQWSMGVLGRVTVGSLSGSDPVDSSEEHSMVAVAPGALLTFTYH